MRAWFACTGAELLARDPADVVGSLSAEQQRRGFSGIADQDGAWRAEIDALRTAIRDTGGESWTIALEFELTRLERRIDAVLLTDRAIICMEFKTAERTPSALRDVEDYALRLRDFHAGSRAHVIVPLLVAGDGPFQAPAQTLLPIDAMHGAMSTGSTGLADALRWIQQQTAAATLPLAGAEWLVAAYAPVPGIIDAARRMFARHDVLDIGMARADIGNLTRTAAAITRALEAARRQRRRVVVVVTGIPGSGKTLCGLNTVFQADARCAFLTGNAPLVTVLRAALLRDALRRKRQRGAAEEEVEGFIQNVHAFLDLHATGIEPPPEEVIVFDEAQRAWDQAKATRHSQNRRSRLTMSEPAHALDIMARRDGWAGIVALIGNGQEINTGEAGLQEWGRSIAAHGGWRAVAAERAAAGAHPRQQLGTRDAPWLTIDDDLDLVVPVRAIRNSAVSGWVEAVIDGDQQRAAQIAAASVLPVLLTRDLDAAKVALRRFAQGHRRAGFVRSAGGKRLRGEGFAAEVAGKDVADWFLRHFPPDVRASDALEAAATEYACQGLELDVVGVAWDLDFRRERGRWVARQLSGTGWKREEKEFDYVRNTYRVLLTRARYETVIWVPRGSRREDPYFDATRDAAVLDATAAYLLACGAKPLVDCNAPPSDTARALLL